MITISMFGKWVLKIPDRYMDGSAMSNELGSLSPFIRSIILRPDLVAIDTYCYKRIVEYCKGAQSVAEYFAGVGIMTLLAEEILHPKFHWISDYSDDCVAFLQDVLCTKYANINCEKRDAFNMQPYQVHSYDLISLDCNMSYGKLVNDPRYRSLVSMTVKKCPKFIHMSDKAAAYFHVNKSKYTKHFGFNVDSIEDYLVGLSLCFRDFGYHISYAIGYKTASHILLTKGIAGSFDFEWVDRADDVDIFSS